MEEVDRVEIVVVVQEPLHRALIIRALDPQVPVHRAIQVEEVDRAALVVVVQDPLHRVLIIQVQGHQVLVHLGIQMEEVEVDRVALVVEEVQNLRHQVHEVSLETIKL